MTQPDTNNSNTPALRIISLGMGQQSTCLYLMSSMGLLERAGYAIFADTGAESPATYRHLQWLLQWQKDNDGIPIKLTGKPSLYRDLVNGTHEHRFASIPAFVRNVDGKMGMLKRQCTQEYKVTPIHQEIRRLHQLQTREKTLPTEVWIGLTLEETSRMRYPQTKWLTYVYPFLNYKCTKYGYENIPYTNLFRRADCIDWLSTHGFPVPPKSSCFFCPFQSDNRWRDTKQNHPEQWKQAVTLDKLMRDSIDKGVKLPVYLHRSGKPLDEVDLKESQLELFNCECSGSCGI